MSTHSNNCGAICTELIQSLESVANGSAPIMKRTAVGAVDGLESPLNMQGSSLQVDQMDGHRRQVRVDYLQREEESQAQNVAPSTCEAGVESCLQSTTFDVNQYSGFQIQFSEDYVSKLCNEGNAEWLLRRVNHTWEALCRDMNTKVLNTLNSNFGTNITTGLTAAVTHDLLDAANKDQIDASAWLDFMGELVNDNQFGGAPIVIASGGFWRFNKLSRHACCNDLGQNMLDLTREAGYSFFNDQIINTEIGDNHAVVLDPGAAQIVPWYKYRSISGGIHQNSGAYGAYDATDGQARGQIVDPMTGRVWDFKLVHDNCAEVFYMNIFLNFDVWTNPTDMYKAADHMSGHNGILHYVFT